MKIMKKIGIFALVFILLFSLMSVSVFAEGAASDAASESATEEKQESGKLDMGLKPESFDERLEYALQGTVTGMLMIFAVLTLLTIILYVSKYIFYDIPNKSKEKARDAENAGSIQPAEPIAVVTHTAPVTQAAPPAVQDDGELVAVITAAVAAMIESSEYKNEFVGGFRVVSFKRSEKTAWNRK